MPTPIVGRIKWDETGERFFETGIDHGVLYPIDAEGAYSQGYGWNGLTAVNESPEGGEPTALYADNIKYLEMMSAEEWKGSIEAYMYPDAFEECDGSKSPVAGLSFGQQARRKFGMAYRTRVGNDIDGDAHGYKIHLLYGLMASPSDKGYETVNDSPDAITFSWDISSTPVAVNDNYKPLSTIVIDSTKLNPTKLAALEAVLWGTDPDETTQTAGTAPRLPMPAEILSMVSE